MGSLNDGSPRMAAFNGDVFPKGLDLRRSVIGTDLGTYVAAEAATIRAGQFVAYDGDGFIVPSAGAGTVGVAKWNKQQFGVSVNVDEPLFLTGTGPINLKRANVLNVSVRSATGFSGVTYTGGGTDYTVNAANGTIARNGGGAIPDNTTVYVTYTYQLTDADFEFDGRDFRNQANNDVQGRENRITVISNWAKLFTMEYDTSVNYSLTAATRKLYVSAEGKATSTAGTDFAGQVCQLPNAEDPYLGMNIHGDPV